MIRKNRIFKLERLIRKKIVLVVVLLFTTICTGGVFAETDTPVKELDQDYKFSISTPWLSFLNIGQEETNIQMYEFHFGYKLTEKDEIKIKVATWKLFEPLGIQMWDPHMLKESEYYPGRLLEYGIGIGYQRTLWKGLFAAIEILPLKQEYLNEDGDKIKDGFRLYTSYHIGYKIPLFNNRFYIAPQIHCNYWPIMTDAPEGFQERENRDWSKNYFLFEPNIHIGVNF